MRFSIAIVAVAASTVSATYAYGNGTDYTTTEVVTSYTTFCPGPTEYVEAGHTYTVTEPTTLTITDCPCTLTKTYATPPPAEETPVYTPPGEDSPVETYPATTYPVTTYPVTYPIATGTGVPPSYNNETDAVPTYAASSAPPAASSTDVYEGAASRLTVAGGALGGLLAVIAAVL